MPQSKNPEQQPTDPDAQILQGHPGSEPPAPDRQAEPPAPKLITVKYGGKEYQMPDDLASAWQDREQDFSRRLSEQSTELGDLRKWKSSVTQTITPQPQGKPDPSVLMFENPAEYDKRLREEIKAELRGEFQAYETENRVWAQFAGKHQDLADERDLVTWIANRHSAELQAMPPSQRQDHLADITRREILRVHSKFGKPNGAEEELSTETPFVEAPGRKTARVAPKEEQPKSLSQIIRGRRAARLYPQEPKGA